MAELYRKTALEKISSPDQLDKMLKVTSPLTYLMLIGATIVIAAAAVWSVLGTLPETVTASGIVAAPVSTNAVLASQSGTVVGLLKMPGDELHLGDPVITVRTGAGEDVQVLSDQVGTVSEMLVSVGTEVKPNAEVIRISPSVTGDQVVVAYIPLSKVRKITRGMQVYVYLTSADSQTYGHMEARVINIDAGAATASGMGYVLGTDNNLSSQLSNNQAVAAVTCELYPDSDSENGYYWSNPKGQKVSVPSGSLCSVKIITDKAAPITKVFSKLKEIWGD